MIKKQISELLFRYIDLVGKLFSCWYYNKLYNIYLSYNYIIHYYNKFHKLSGLNNTDLSYSFMEVQHRSHWVNIRCQEALWGNLFPYPLQLLEAAHILCLVTLSSIFKASNTAFTAFTFFHNCIFSDWFPFSASYSTFLIFYLWFYIELFG